MNRRGDLYDHPPGMGAIIAACSVLNGYPDIQLHLLQIMNDDSSRFTNPIAVLKNTAQNGAYMAPIQRFIPIIE